MASISIYRTGIGASRTREGLPCVIVEVSEGVCSMVGFGVIPVSAVVGIGGGESVIFR